LPPRRSWDGICGLGWQDIAKVERPVYQRLQGQGLPAAFTLIPASTTSAQLVMGLPAQSVYKPGTLIWTPAESLVPKGHGPMGGKRSFWVFFGGLAITKKTPQPSKFLVDTGTNQVLLAPPKYFKAFMRSFIPPHEFDSKCGMDRTAGGLVICECSLAENPNLKPLRIYLGGRPFTLPAADLFSRVPARDGGDLCLLLVQPNPMAHAAMPVPDIIGDLLGGLLRGGSSNGGIPIMGGSQVGGSIPVVISKGPPSSGGRPISSPFHNGGSTSGVRPAETPPFPFPGLFGPHEAHNPFGQHGNGRFPVGQMGEVIETITETGRDGRVCTTTLVKDANVIKKNTTHCVSQGQVSRRLQTSIPLLSGSRGMVENPMEDLWVLGGIFLERFVTCFDFDGHRLGFAEPVTPVTSGNKIAPLLNEVETSKSGGPLIRSNSEQNAWLLHGAIICVCCSVVTLMVYVRRKTSHKSGRSTAFDAQELEDGPCE